MLSKKAKDVLERCLQLVRHELRFRPNEAAASGRQLEEDIKTVLIQDEIDAMIAAEEGGVGGSKEK